jgi:hypothetical protein
MKNRVSFRKKSRQTRRMKSSLILLFVVSCSLLSCATSKQEKPKTAEKKTADAGPTLVGRIATIPADKRFVLIQHYGKWEDQTGQILTTRGPDERTANLKVTGEKLGEFSAADLQSGTVEVGDAVYFHQAVKTPSLLITPEVSQAQSQTPVENVQKNN